MYELRVYLFLSYSQEVYLTTWVIWNVVKKKSGDCFNQSTDMLVN